MVFSDLMKTQVGLIFWVSALIGVLYAEDILN
jgi:hypothetical protein